MKLKGIKPIEQHVDKIAVGLAAAAGLGLLVWQFMKPNEVKVGNAKETPARAFKPIENEARELDRKLNLPALPDGLKAPEVSDNGQLAFGAGAKLGDAIPAVALGPAPAIGKASGGGPVAAATFQAPLVPAPTAVATHAFRNTLSPMEVARHPELAKSGLIPVAQPFDKAAVSIEGTFSGLALKEQLLGDPDGGGPLEPIPLAWWRDVSNDAADLLAVLAVQMERETLRNPDGTTPDKPEIVIVPPLPGRPDTLALWNSGIKAIGDVPSYVEQMRAMSEEILRPTYFSTVAGPAWQPPSEAIAAGDTEGKGKLVETKKKDLREIDDRIAELKAKIEQAPAAPPGGARPPVDPRTPPPRSGGGSGGGGGGKGGGGGGGGPPPPRQAPAVTEPVLNRKQLENALKNQTEKRTRLVKQLTDLGEKIESPEDAMKAAPAAAAASALPLIEQSEIKVFAHDFTAKPGAQYRYRTRVVTNNPLYGRNLQESQKQLGEKKVLEGAWSEWSRPIDVDPDAYYFITSAEPAGELNPTPRAVAEMFVFYYGYYRNATVGLEPGDIISGEPKVPELKIADMKKIEEAFKTGENLMAPGGGPPPLPGNPRSGGGGGKTGAGRDSDTRDVRRGGPAPMAEAPPAMNADWMTVAAPKPPAQRVDAVFLDATPIPVDSQGLGGEVRTRHQAIFRNAAGQIAWRQPDIDRTMEAFKRLQASAKAGETQGQPKIEPETNKPNLPPKRDTPPRPPQAPRTGGGGGGGG